MAVKASATITLTSYRDTQSVTRYYKLQTAGSSAPSKPTTKPPSSDWTDSEPACDISKELYFCDLTIFSNGEGEYSKVSKSSSYEAAKEAYHKAQSAKDSIDDLEIGGKNYFSNKTNSEFNEANEFTLANYQNTGSFTQFRNLTVPMSYFVGKKCILSFDCISPNGSTPISVYNQNGNPRYRINTSGIISPINNEWIHQELIITVTDLGDSSSYDEAQSNKIEIYCSAQMGCKVRNVKLEIGNRATDWTPAPEDVDAGISEAQGNALSAQENADALDVDLNDFKSNEYSQINNKVGELVEYKGENEKEIGKIREELSQELVAQKFARIEPDKGSLILGEINGTTAVLTNEQFGFYTPNSEIAAAYFGKDNDAWAFNIERGIIKNDLRFSGFQWIARSNKNMSLKWIK